MCPISRDVFNDDDTVTQIIPCGHIFSRTNLQQWFTYHSACPMCRYDIRNYTPNTVGTNTVGTNTVGTNTARNNNARNNTARNNTARNNNDAFYVNNNYTTLDNIDLNNIVEQIAGDILNNTDISGNNISLEYSLYTPYNISNNSRLIPIFNRAVNHRTSIDPSLNL